MHPGVNGEICRLYVQWSCVSCHWWWGSGGSDILLRQIPTRVRLESQNNEEVISKKLKFLKSPRLIFLEESLTRCAHSELAPLIAGLPDPSPS